MFKSKIKTGVYLDWEQHWTVVYKGVKFAKYPFRQLNKALKKLETLIAEDDENVSQIVE